MPRVFLGNSGTEAIEAAIKLARYHTGRSQFIGFMGGFHGRTLGALGFTASKTVQRRGFMPIQGVTHIPYPYTYRPTLAAQPDEEDYGETVVNYLKKTVFKSLVAPEDVAAIVVEPIQGEGGYVVPPPSFFPMLREVCDEHGILLIVDEVQTGVGRTGRWWAIEHWGVEPDIVCTAKGIASGIPLGGIIARESVSTWPVSAHGNTYGGNPIACAAALATLDVLENGGLQNAAEQGDYMLRCFGEMQARHPEHRRRTRQGPDDRRRVRAGPRQQGARCAHAQPRGRTGLRARPADHGVRRQLHAHHPAADPQPCRSRRRSAHLRLRAGAG